jgi:hypothetical protein
VRPIVERAIAAVDTIEFAEIAAREGECLERCGRPPEYGKRGYCSPCFARSRHLLPAAPLAAMIDRLIAQARASDHFLNITDSQRVTRSEVLCEALGVTDRTVHRWRVGSGRVRIESAERVLLNAGATWAEVWPPDAFPELYRGPLAGDDAI